MKSKICYFGVMMILLAAVSANAAALKDVAVITSCEGDAQIRLNDESEWGPCEKELGLQMGDTIKTGIKAKVKIIFESESLIVIGPLSIFEISDYKTDGKGKSNALFNLEQGQVRAGVSKMKTKDSTFEVKTPTAVAGVRGTDFAVEALKDENKTTVTVFDGEVDVTSRIGKIKNIIRLLKEQASDVGSDGASKPRKVDRQKLERLRMLLSEKLNKNGNELDFKKAVALVLIRSSDMDSKDKGNLAKGIKEGLIDPKNVRQAVTLRDKGVPDNEIGRLIEVSKQQKMTPQEMKQFVEKVGLKPGDAKKDIDVLAGKQEGKSVEPAGVKPKPDSDGKAMPSNPDSIKEGLANGGAAGSKADDLKRKESFIVEQAIALNIPKEQIDKLLEAYRSGKIQMVDIKLTLEVIKKGGSLKDVRDFMNYAEKLQLDIPSRRLIMHAISVGLPKDKVEELMAAVEAKKITIEQLKERVKQYIKENSNSSPMATIAVKQAQKAALKKKIAEKAK